MSLEMTLACSFWTIGIPTMLLYIIQRQMFLLYCTYFRGERLHAATNDCGKTNFKPCAADTVFGHFKSPGVSAIRSLQLSETAFMENLGGQCATR